MKKTLILAIFLAITVGGVAQEPMVPQPYSGKIQIFVELLANRRKNTTNEMFMRSYLYFPVIEKSLQRHQIPDYLKYLAMVESTLNVSAKAKDGRMGLWQITPNLAADNGLIVTAEVNDCFDPELASEVACRRLQELHSYYGDWLLSIAAYNTSVATVDQAIAKAGGDHDYWAVHDHLPREAQGFVPAFLAVTYVMSHPDEFDLKPMCGIDVWSDTETITLIDSLSFSRISSSIGITMEELCMLNPKYVKKRIPLSNERCYSLRLPKRFATQFKQAIHYERHY